MNTHYCKVGKKRPSLNRLISLKAIEDKAVQFAEVVCQNKSTQDFDVAT